MKKLLIAVGVVVVLAGGAVAVVPRLIPADRIKDEVASQVKAATGRDLSIQGDVSLSVFPSLAVGMANVALSNPAGFSTKEMAQLGQLEVRLKLLPLLSGRAEVESFVMVDPVVTLETDAKGRANWVFDSGKAGEQKPEAKAEKAPGSGKSPLSDLSLGDVRIKNGKLVWQDGKSGTREEVVNINLGLTLLNLDSPLAAKGGLTWRQKAVDLSLDLGRPRAILNGEFSPMALGVTAESLKLVLQGQASATAVKGDLDLSVPSVRALAAWVGGQPLDLPGTGLGPASVKGKLSAEPGRIAFTQAALALDGIAAIGDVTVQTGGPRPVIKGKLAVDSLDLNPYLPPEDQQKAAANGKGTAGAKAAGWSDDPIDVSAFKAADVDFTLSAGTIKVRRITIGKSALRLMLAQGKLTANLSELSLYQGSGKGRLVLDGSGQGLGVDADFDLKGVQAEPFLSDAAGLDRITGTGAAKLQLTGRGKTERQIISSLGGRGNVAFTDGAIKGINLAAMVRNVTSAFTDTGGQQKTDFSELGGTFTIASGILSNKDLALKSPLLRVEGAGTVDLPQRRLSYRVTPKAVASLEGQGGKQDLSGIMVPVLIEGPWDALTYRPDLKAMVKGKAAKALEGALPNNNGKKPALPQGLDPRKLLGR